VPKWIAAIEAASRQRVLAMLGCVCLAVASPGAAQPPKAESNPAPSAQDWADLGKLPDWSGVWIPDRNHPNFKFGSVPAPWTPEAAAYLTQQLALVKAGTPNNIYINCLPDGMPSLVTMARSGSEFLFTPGRVTILGENDSQRVRRIYTDGRPHPEDPDLTFSGHSIGRWEGDTLVIDTIGILPQVFLPLGQAVGIPNNGGMHIVERIRLVDPDHLEDALEIEAPKVLTAPWRITKGLVRSRDRRHDIVEASCRQGDFQEAVDAHGNHVFVPVVSEPGGARLLGERP
jgi:hypothetical protein